MSTNGARTTGTAQLRRSLSRGLTSIRLAARARSFLRSVEIHPRSDLLFLGSRGYGFWVVPANLLGPASRCYLAGVGEDITFDLALIARFGCNVHAFDPVPAAQRYAVAADAHEPRFNFHPIGLWSTDTTLPLYAPAVDGYVSHSATNLHKTEEAFDAEVRSVASLMREFGDQRLDLLKISAEGSEYEILAGLARDDVDVKTICVEFAQPAPRGRAEKTVDELLWRGYDMVDAHITPWTWKLTFVRR
jgi:FkbM family methyltransferase